MRDEALVHFHLGRTISPGIHLARQGIWTPGLIGAAAELYDAASPGRSAAGFCAVHHPVIGDLTPPPPHGWQAWRWIEWDQWFGRVHGVFLVDLEQLAVTQFAMYRTGPRRVACDFSRMPGRIAMVTGEPPGEQKHPA
jgi:hypothetical protein